MKFKKNNVKIEITETKDDKICIDITTSKEVVVNVKKEFSENISPKKNIDLTEEKFRITNIVERSGLDEIPDDDYGLIDIVKRGNVNASFSLTDVVIRDPKNNKEQ